MKINICIPIQVRTQKEAKKAMKDAAKQADMAEIWLDHIRDLDLYDLLKNKPLPVICVCKKPIEKGRFKGTHAQAIDLLMEAVENGADYVDVPHSSSSGLTRGSSKILDSRFHGNDIKKSKLILSYHNFIKTPPTSVLLKKAQEMKKAGAGIVKISTMAKTLNDTIRIITLAKQLQKCKIPHILIAMGKAGVLSRVLTPTLGGTIMFAPLSKAKTSAPGQLTVEELREAWKLIL